MYDIISYSHNCLCWLKLLNHITQNIPKSKYYVFFHIVFNFQSRRDITTVCFDVDDSLCIMRFSNSHKNEYLDIVNNIATITDVREILMENRETRTNSKVRTSCNWREKRKSPKTNRNVKRATWQYKNKTNHPISSNSHPSVTANIAIHCLKRGREVQNQRNNQQNQRTETLWF